MTYSLCPRQQTAFEQLLAALDRAFIFRLCGDGGRGKTTVLRAVHARTGGAWLSARELVEGASGRDPLALEEAFYQQVREALEHHSHVYVDDVSLLMNVIAGWCDYPRTGYVELPVKALCALAETLQHRLVLETQGDSPSAAADRSHDVSIDAFLVEDYAALCAGWLGTERAAAIDFAKVYRFASKLDAHQLRAACQWLAHEPGVTTESCIDYLRTVRLASNVDLEEVQPVDLRELEGIEDVVRSLEIHIALPLESGHLAEKLALRPKRGVLLYGPPGTGKTTVGRALAHRLKGKFFRIDGTFIAGARDFYRRIDEVFEEARDNSPAVIFVDDADAIFEDGEERGLYRYLLTQLDGLESESNSRVCVMLTAMNLCHLPPALVRSGRVELWLEMKLPDAAARRRILDRHMEGFPESLRAYDTAAALGETDGFTGADLKRAVEDAKGLYAYDLTQGQAARTTTAYLLDAIAQVRANKKKVNFGGVRSAHLRYGFNPHTTPRNENADSEPPGPPSPLL
jgi:transitional endoplasmic reticulum ATPase